jgi:hypothetical protein
VKRLLTIFCILLWPAAAGALPGNYSLEAYTAAGKRPFAGYWTYYQRVYTTRQVRYLHQVTRQRHRHARKYCGVTFRMSARNLAYIRSHRARGHRILIKRYLGHRGGVRRFRTVCQL